MGNTQSRRQISGILILDKPAGMTSNQALRKVQGFYNAAKAGHTGSLDPLATGVLPLCFGSATKSAQQLLEAPKTYSTTILLGTRTSTDDIDGEVLEKRVVTEAQLARIPEAITSFRGKIQQIPPMYSALKHQGQPLYKLARQGIEVERAARSVEVYSNEIDDIKGEHLSLTISCSKGTYIRTLAYDLGEALGCGGCVMRLRRLVVGPFSEADTCSMDELQALSENQDMAALDSRLLKSPVENNQFVGV